MLKRNWLPAIIGLFVSFATFLAATAFAQEKGDYNFVIVDSFSEGASGSSEIYALPESQVQDIIDNVQTNYLPSRKFCETLSAAPCQEQTGLSLRIYLPVCSATVLNFCIESMGVSANSESPIQTGTLLGYTTGRNYPADPAKGLPEAASTSRWKVPNVFSKNGTDTYAVKLLLDGFHSYKANKLFVFQVSAVIEPYVEFTNNGNPSSECTSWQSGTNCGQRTDFVEGQKAELTVRLPNTITGWLSGRFKGASIAINKFDSNQNKLTVSAETVKVPELNTSLTEAQFKTLPNPSFFMISGIQWSSVNAGNLAALDWIKQLSGVLNDTATGEHSTWSFSTISPNGNINKCFQDKTQLLGLVMTNSLVYAPAAPDFDGQQLNYQVGGLHFKKDGKTLNTGTYDLLIRSATARCLYNFTDAPLSASVTVTTPNGSEQAISTTVLSEKDGWLHLGAYGFTYSTPTLRVKLKGVSKNQPESTGKSPAQNNAQPTSKSSKNSPSKSASKSTSSVKKTYVMTCVKDKVVTKMTVPEPNCPIGWKKK